MHVTIILFSFFNNENENFFIFSKSTFLFAVILELLDCSNNNNKIELEVMSFGDFTAVCHRLIQFVI